MPALRIQIDDVVVATISTAGMTMIDVRQIGRAHV